VLPSIELREITSENHEAVVAVRVTEPQLRFVGTVEDALLEADEAPEGKPWYRGVYKGQRPVGFVMLSWDVVPDPPHIIGPWFLWKLIINEQHQRRGIGTKVVRLIADLVRNEGATELLTSHVEGAGDPGPFYRRLGFRPTGERDDNGEVILALDLT
jgi:diamine N-acetyltransferase